MLKCLLAIYCLAFVGLQAENDYKNGRYQISTVFNDVYRNSEVYLVDTQTGQVWVNYGYKYDDWRALPPPVLPSPVEE
jgi:hypothetical protein